MEKIRYKYNIKKKKDYILFLHGWGGDENSFLDIFSKLQKYYSVISINMTDITTKYLDKPLTMFDYVIKVFEILKKLHIKSVHIVCHSFGFRVALILNRYFNINLQSLVVIDGAGIKDVDLKTKLKIISFKFLKLLVRLKLIGYNKLSNFGSLDYKSLDLVQKQTFKNIVNYDLKDYVKFINCKTLIVWGRYDLDTRLKIAKYLNQKIKNSNLKVYNAGHFSYLECKYDFEIDIFTHFDSI